MILMLNKLFGKLEKKTGVKMTEVMKLAQSLQNSNFKDEETVRSVIQQVSSLAKKPVPKKTEEMMVKAIINNKIPQDLSSLSKMADNKKK
jgi:hypothetical protein